MTAATIWAQKGVPDSTSKQSAELDMLVDIAEMDLLADMLESLLREEENAQEVKGMADGDSLRQPFFVA